MSPGHMDAELGPSTQYPYHWSGSSGSWPPSRSAFFRHRPSDVPPSSGEEYGPTVYSDGLNADEVPWAISCECSARSIHLFPFVVVHRNPA